jgi:hypothetical protein
MGFSAINESALRERMRQLLQDAHASLEFHDNVVPLCEPKPLSWTLSGISGKTRVETAFGLVPAQLLRVGDMLKTRESGFQRVLRISDVKIDLQFLASRPDAAPVIIAKNAFGSNVPTRDVELSPAHRVYMAYDRNDDPGVPAELISSRRGTIATDLGMLVYIQVYLSRHARINCDGVWVEGAGV